MICQLVSYDLNHVSQVAAHILPVGDPAVLITVNFFYGNVFYIVRRAKLAWLQLVQPLAFLRIQDGVSAILNFGQCPSFDLDDIEGRVIPLYKGLPFLELFFGYWVKVQVKSEVRGKI